MKTITCGLPGIAAICLAAQVCAGEYTQGSAGEGAEKSERASDARGAVRAKDADKRRGALEEVVVTAQKQEQMLQDVPISMSVLGGDELDRYTTGGALDALSRVPGVSIDDSFIGSGAQIPIRGVAASASLGSGSSPTAIYLDSVPFGFVAHASGPDPDVYDLERIEVLRGPQGTLFGAGGMAGVVRILTKDADLDTFGLKARGSTSYTEDGSESYRADAAINVPIIDEKLAVRAVLGYQDMGGWVDRPNEKDANDSEQSNLRLKVNARPTEQLRIGASAWFSREDVNGLPNASDEHRQSPVLVDEPSSTDYDVYAFDVGYDFSSLSLKSATSYIDYANNSNISLVFISPSDPRWIQQRDLTAQTFSQEVTLTSNTTGPWRWLAGGMYRESKDRNTVIINATYLAPSGVENESKSYAVFGELTRTFWDGKFELTGGLRYFEDEVELTELSRNNAAPPEVLIRTDDKFDATTPRVVLTWKPTQQLTSYVSYSEGFRSGAGQDPAILQFEPSVPAVEPDTLRNYEIGAKGSVLDGRLTFDTAVFYMDWEDVQLIYGILSPQGRSLTVRINSESASGMGFEFSLAANPVERLQLGITFGWNDLTLDGDVNTASGLLFAKGDRLNLSPEYTAGAWADYVFPLAATGLQARLSASGNYMSEQVTRNASAGQQVTQVGDSILIGRASFAVESDSWSAQLFVDNFSDEDGVIRDFPAIAQSWDSHPRPRSFGLQVEYRY